MRWPLDSDSGAATHRNLAVDATLPAGAADAQGLGRVVAPITRVEIGPLDLDVGECLGLLDDGPQGVVVVGVANWPLNISLDSNKFQVKHT